MIRNLSTHLSKDLDNFIEMTFTLPEERTTMNDKLLNMRNFIKEVDQHAKIG